jgi:hypothetical protein
MGTTTVDHTIHIRNVLILIVVSFYLILNYGFMQLRIPPIEGGGIPIGELTLLISLATTNVFIVLLRFSKVIVLAPFIVWWILGFFHAYLGILNHGMWALRDATHLIESLFLLIGFTFAGRPEAIETFFRWLPKILVVGSIYAIGYPFSELLKSISPKILTGSGQFVPIFFNYTNTSVVLLVSVSYVMLFTSWSNIFTIRYFITAAFLLGFTAFLFQARTIYLQVLALLLFFSFFCYRVNRRFIYIIVATLILLFIIAELDLKIEGRLGQKISLTFLKNHFLAIFGVEAEGVVASARGITQRIEWWRNLMENWSKKVGTILFGMGYGLPLIDFKMNYGVIVREPHNSYISIIARLGLIGAIAWAWMHILLIKIWHQTYKRLVDIGWQEGQNRILILMVFFILIWIFAIGEDAFEKPFNAIPYYFFWGIVLRCTSYLKYDLIGPKTFSYANFTNKK